jgi:uncharacterized membrane protein YphA (DoxX/SURF4 family)
MTSKWSLGKLIYSLPLSITGLIYLINPQGTVETLTSFIPGGLTLIYIGGILWLALGLALALNIKTKIVTMGIIILLSSYIIIIHIPALTLGEYLSLVWFELLRNLSLMGGAVLILAGENHTAHK